MGAPEGEGGGGGEENGVNLPSALRLLKNSSLRQCYLLRDEDDIDTVQFYSVIYNSVPGPHMNRQKRFCKLFRFCEDICEKHVPAWSMTMLTHRKFFYFGKS